MVVREYSSTLTQALLSGRHVSKKLCIEQVGQKSSKTICGLEVVGGIVEVYAMLTQAISTFPHPPNRAKRFNVTGAFGAVAVKPLVA